MPEHFTFNILSKLLREETHPDEFHRQIERYRNGKIAGMPTYQGKVTISVNEGSEKTHRVLEDFSLQARVLVGHGVLLPKTVSSQYPDAFSALFFDGLTKVNLS